MSRDMVPYWPINEEEECFNPPIAVSEDLEENKTLIDSLNALQKETSLVDEELKKALEERERFFRLLDQESKELNFIRQEYEKRRIKLTVEENIFKDLDEKMQLQLNKSKQIENETEYLNEQIELLNDTYMYEANELNFKLTDINDDFYEIVQLIETKTDEELTNELIALNDEFIHIEQKQIYDRDISSQLDEEEYMIYDVTERSIYLDKLTEAEMRMEMNNINRLKNELKI